MKKIYSLVLMAVILLIGTNAWAEVHEANDATSFENAWKAAQHNDIIRLTGSFSLSGKTFWLGSNAMNGAFKSITLDLNGQTLTASDNTSTTKLFVISHGEMKVITSQVGGQIIHSGASSSSTYEIFRLMGSTYKTVDPSVENAAYYSHLVIDNGVTLTAKANGIVLDYATWSNWGTCVATKDAGSIPSYNTNVYTKSRGTANGVRVDIFGTIYAHKYAVKANGNMGSPDTAPTARSGYFEDPEQTIAYQVLATDVQYSPYIYVHSGARLETLDKDTTYAIAAYSGGYSRWKIEGTCIGSTGVYVKSGQLTINNATIASNYTGNYKPAEQDRTSGVDAAGSGIVMESSTAYAGGIDVTVSGTTTVTPTSGYAVDEAITQNNGNGDSKVEGITIEGGRFEEGGEGTISITQKTAGTGSGSGTSHTVTITGGTIEAGDNGSTTSIGGLTLQEFLVEQTGDTHAVVVEVDAQGNETVVVSNGVAPTIKNTPIGQDGTAVNWINADDTRDTLVADLTLTELQISQDYNQTLVVPDGLTLSVGRVVMGAKAQIVVKAGGKFVVTGAQGLAAFQESNLILETSESKPAIFLFNPAVTSNTHPMATVEFLSKSYVKSNTNWARQCFGIPTYQAMTSIAAINPALESTDPDYNVRTKFGRFNYSGNAWEVIGEINSSNTQVSLSDMANPFDYYQMINYNAGQTKVIMKGQLVGNTIPQLHVRGNFWNGYANSCTAPMNINVLLGEIPNTVQKAIYLLDITEDQTIWIARTFLNEDDEDMQNVGPLQPFMINNALSAADVNVSYEKAVYNPAMGINNSNPAPRRVAANDMTKVNIIVKGEGNKDRIVVAESDEFTAEFDNGYDAAKYMNDGINLYVSANEMMSNYATDDLENTYVGFQAVKAGDYTIEFANVRGEELTLVDLETGARVAMVEGGAYEFTADANSVNDYRFQITKINKVATDIENAEAVKNVKGIYTITGQYVGEMNVWNTLPAGVYVVNGEKRVK